MYDDDNEGAEVLLSVADFREVGRPMTYFVLCDVLRGLGEFMMGAEVGTEAAAERERWFGEVGFEVEVERAGYVASGGVSYLVSVGREREGEGGVVA